MAKFDAGDLIELANQIAALVAEAAGLVPQLIENFEEVKSKMSSNDIAVVEAAIDQFHGLSQSLAEQLEAQRDPPAPEATKATTKAAETGTEK